MGKPPSQSVDLGPSPNIDHEKDMAENGAPASATKAIYWIIAIGVIALFALVGIGLHIPTGG
ncbi:MAG: hypothetical protein HOV81_15055 [Kofleriaceae bacterium]|nr:hypothetical protein [Kofleriaceae bacterium]